MHDDDSQVHDLQDAANGVKSLIRYGEHQLRQADEWEDDGEDVLPIREFWLHAMSMLADIRTEILHPEMERLAPAAATAE